MMFDYLYLRGPLPKPRTRIVRRRRAELDIVFAMDTYKLSGHP